MCAFSPATVWRPQYSHPYALTNSSSHTRRRKESQWRRRPHKSRLLSAHIVTNKLAEVCPDFSCLTIYIPRNLARLLRFDLSVNWMRLTFILTDSRLSSHIWPRMTQSPSRASISRRRTRTPLRSESTRRVWFGGMIRMGGYACSVSRPRWKSARAIRRRTSATFGFFVVELCQCRLLREPAA